jgi:acetate kinase
VAGLSAGRDRDGKARPGGTGRPGVRVLVLNAGSSSLKASLVETPDRTVAQASTGWGSDATAAQDRRGDVSMALERLGLGARDAARLDAVGHRVVHGGDEFRAATLVDDAVVARLRHVSDLAPLHNRVALETVETARALLSDVPHVACFDTAFHATLPEDAWRYPVPAAWRDDWGVRRYGFHGLSVEWAVARAAGLLGREPAGLAVVVAHLGSGCSVTAVRGGRSTDTSMGLTPLEGLMMGTRSGSIDPGILLRLLSERRLTLDELAETLDHRSGLLGVSGRSGDVRELTAAADAGDARATLALRMFARRAAAGIAAASTALPRLDALVFTGGIGEHAASVREDIVRRLAVIGIDPLPAPRAERARTDADRGGAAGEPADARLSDPASRVAVLRVVAREDLVIARQAADAIGRLPD